MAEWAVALRLAIRHHPLCDRFDGDRFGPVCSGCAMFWPVFLIATPLAFVALRAGVDAPLLFGMAVLMGFPQVLGMRRRLGRAARATIKALGGVAVALAIPAILFLPLPLWARIGLLITMWLAFIGLLWLRAVSILKTCDACSWKRDWGRCPGFGALEAP